VRDALEEAIVAVISGVQSPEAAIEDAMATAEEVVTE
jgi:hypothetical protein